jgi:hypothetical protein
MNSPGVARQRCIRGHKIHTPQRPARPGTARRYGSVSQSSCEPPIGPFGRHGICLGEPARFHGYLLAVTMLQRLLLSLNTLRIIGVRPELTLPKGKRFAGDVSRKLERLGDAIEKGTRPASSQELDEALHALRGAMARTAGSASLRPIVIARVGQQVLTLHVAATRLIAERRS